MISSSLAAVLHHGNRLIVFSRLKNCKVTQHSFVLGWLLIGSGYCWAGLAGCSPSPPTLAEVVQQAGELPGVRQTNHLPLRAEFELLVQEGALPKQFTRSRLPDYQNAALQLDQVMAEGDWTSVDAAAADFLAILPTAESNYVAIEANTMASEWRGEIASVADASRFEQCDFGLHYEWGFFNDVGFLSRASVACRLLLVDAISRLDTSSAQAVMRFGQAWRWIDWLTEEKHLESRLTAAELRTNALAVAAWIANHPATTPQEWRFLQERLEASLATWPSTEATLQRERALALHTYEMIRVGLVDQLFTLQERADLQAQDVLAALRKASPEQIDADEAMYLKYIRQHLEVANQPFYARRKQLLEADQLLRIDDNPATYPWFATQLFSDNLTLAQAELARDRARVEGWILALATARQVEPPKLDKNPLNGSTYPVETVDGVVHVDLEDQRTVNPHIRLSQGPL